jgi:hypothetical protein
MHGTTTIAYRYEIEGDIIILTRRHIGTAYPRNGNVHNPTEYFRWEAMLNEVVIGTHFEKRADAYESARGFQYCNDKGRVRGEGKPVRYWHAVKAEMKAALKGRSTPSVGSIA